jgi:hypothetical protein
MFRRHPVSHLLRILAVSKQLRLQLLQLEHLHVQISIHKMHTMYILDTVMTMAVSQAISLVSAVTLKAVDDVSSSINNDNSSHELCIMTIMIHTKMTIPV